MKILLSLLLLFFFSCQINKSNLADEMREAIKKDPTIVTDAFSEHPIEFIKAFKNAVRKEQEQKEALAQEAAFSNPKRPNIRADEAIRGTKNAPLVFGGVFRF